MLTSRTSHRFAIAIAAISLSACDYDCGTRGGTIASGTVRDAAGANLATVDASVTDYLRPTFLRLSIGVMAAGGSAGAPLKGHVTGARLVAESGEVLSEIPTGTGTLYLDVVVALNVDLPSREEYERVRSALYSTRAKVILETDLPGRERIETILGIVREVPENIQHCRWN
jgi:hypothetical protein